ncbi:MAG: Phosphoribosylamine--glycine ligase [Candidatus Hydrogenedentes bacterium ADurb.Bin101]|nr:MAG: Phosphoribosylamine--glycine ligase [Candidatus Hydrogenedentes bacterium ADurb.Bin101]
MNVLIIGSGGREHALAWKIARSPLVQKIYAAPGNPGIDRLDKGVCVNVAADDFEVLRTYIEAERIELVVVGPEDPLAKGIVDTLGTEDTLVFGPSARAARLEASKSFAKEFMARHKIPAAEYAVFDDARSAIDYIRAAEMPIVIKADGLASGKGVTVADSVEKAEAAIRAAMIENTFGLAGQRVVVEACLVGEEASILVFCDGKTFKPLASSQDHKREFDQDQGRNTGGMGAYSPAPIITDAMMDRINREILEPCLRGMEEEGMPYTGILYAGLMITKEGPKVIEFNVRFGDPETQAILPRMDTDIVPILKACCTGTLAEYDIEYKPQPCVTVVMASEGYPGPYEKGKPIRGIESAEALDNVQVFIAGVKQNGEELVTSGGRVLNVTAWAPTLPGAIEKAYAAVERIHFDGAKYRKDIGKKALRHL